MPRGVGVRVPLSARMFEASDFSSRSSFFVVLGKCKHSPQQQKRLGLRPLASICAIRSMVYGVAGIERYYTFKGIPASPALRLAVEVRFDKFLLTFIKIINPKDFAFGIHLIVFLY